MRVGIVVVVYSEYPRLVFDSIITDTIHDVTWYVHCHSTDSGIEKSLIEFCESNRCELQLHRDNRGLARSWNDGIVASYAHENDFTLVINDDVCFRAKAFDSFITFLMDKPAFALGFLHGEEPASDGAPSQIRRQDFACFALGTLAYSKVGAFDENFFPAYKEDIDYFIRVKKLNLPVIEDVRTLVDHERSKTIKRHPDLRAHIHAVSHGNTAYFARKWGWEENGTTYDEQFKCRGQFISWSARRAPFASSMDREDLAAAKAPVLSVRTGCFGADLSACSSPHLVAARQQAICAYVVQAMYRCLLHRDPEPGAMERYSREFLDGLRGITELSDQIRDSPEYRALSYESPDIRP